MKTLTFGFTIEERKVSAVRFYASENDLPCKVYDFDMNLKAVIPKVPDFGDNDVVITEMLRRVDSTDRRIK